MNDEPDVILTGRLAQCYDPFKHLGIEPPKLSDIEHLDDIEFRPAEDRDEAYHRRRLATFVRQIRSGQALEPIPIDNKCWGGYISPCPIVLDGHHRLGAAILADAPTLLIDYGGRLDVLKWLTGQTDEPPED